MASSASLKNPSAYHKNYIWDEEKHVWDDFPHLKHNFGPLRGADPYVVTQGSIIRIYKL